MMLLAQRPQTKIGIDVSDTDLGTLSQLFYLY